MKITKQLIFLFVVSAFLSFGGEAQNKLPDWALGPFIRPVNQPIISPKNTMLFSPITKDSVRWEKNATFNPAATIKKDSVFILYRAESARGQGIGGHTSRIGLAVSANGIDIIKRDEKPVLFPEEDAQKEMEWPGGCEDPRVAVTGGGKYVIFYTQWNKKTPRLAAATSRDLYHWKKHGSIFKMAYNGKFFDMSTKSASIVTEIKEGKQVIAKINGKYFMYWGEHHIYAATSTDLVDWKPLVDEEGNLTILASPRKGYFDSELTECGPPAVITKDGILLIYNGKNATNHNKSKDYAAGTYSAGQIMFDKKDPTQVLARLDRPFFVPEMDFEKTGQYQDGTVFTEGLVYFHDKWLMYYGAADSRVGVAMFDPNKEKK
ncbi:MAG TPA: glycoside hydrolase family 130 protein [Chitinophagaceae bacterium]|nr:glycoside hydrolase family 130 protein [Chitinophagaceae bacterium]